MGNTILVTYRDRKKSLKTFLDTLLPLEPETELLIINLGSVEPFKDIIPEDNKSIKVIDIPYDGVFWKTKALNLGLKLARYEYVTIMDVDIKFPRDFFKDVAPLWKQYNKVGYIVSYTKALDYGDGADSTLGCALYTTKKQYLMDIGGYNEFFIGWGLEDVECNQRFFKKYGAAHIYPIKLKHQPHKYETEGWRNPVIEKQTEDMYRNFKQDGFPKPENGDYFGDFREWLGDDYVMQVDVPAYPPTKYWPPSHPKNSK